MGRGGWLAGRLLQILPTFLLIGLAVFVLARLLPGNAVEAMLGDRGTDAAVASLTHQLGLDQSIGMQLVTFLGSAVHGNFGTSLAFHIPVSRLIVERLPVTLTLTGLSILFALVVALPLAFIAALNANRWPDLVIRGVFQVGLSSPIFYVGLVLLPELFSNELDTIADDIQVVELARYTDIALLPEMNVKTAMKLFDDAEAEVLAVLESAESRKVIGFLSESFARRRYVEEIDQATRGVLGALS